MTFKSLAFVPPFVVVASAAFAHSEGGTGSFFSGFSHPINGWDHIVAMVAVGIWGAFLGKPALWILPIVFPMVMAFGGAMGIVGLPLPAVETGIALSSVALGGLIAFAMRFPLWAAGLIVGIFAVFHGYAHGVELPDSATPFGFGFGFVVATGLLHLGGIGFGFLANFPFGAYAIRVMGALISIVGASFLVGG